MLENPLNHDNMKYDVDVTDFPSNGNVWDEISLEDFEAHRQQRNLPDLNIDTVTAFNNLSLGNYRYYQNCQR